MKFVLILTILLSSTNSLAKVTIYGLHLPYRLEMNSQTPYYQLIQSFTKEYKLPHSFLVYPIKRATHLFYKNKVGCYIPVSKKAMKLYNPDFFKQFNFIESDPIELVQGKLFAFDKKALSKLNQTLKDKTISSWRGINTSNIFTKKVKSEIKTSGDLQSLRLLKANKVDLIAGFIPDTLLTASNHKYPKLYASKYSFIETSVHLVCYDTNENRKIIKDFNHFLYKNKKAHKLQKILGPHSIIK